MNTDYIKEFVTLSDCMSFSEASNILFISQSSLSKHIQSLEKDLGVKLFERTTRHVKLTDAGLTFLIYAQKIDALCDETRIEIEDILTKSSRSLTIATMHNPQYYNLAKYMISFHETHPEITFQMVESDEFGLYEMFAKHQVNIFPTYELFPVSQGDYTFMPMVRSNINAIFRSDHPQAGRKTIDLKQLASENLLLPMRNSTLSKLMLSTFEDAGIKPNIVYEGSSSGCIDLVKAGMGVSLHADEFIRTIKDHEDISCVRIKPTIQFVYGLGHRNPNTLSQAEKIYLSHMKRFELKD